MKSVSRFVAKFASLISSVLHCFDRVIFKGYLSFSRTDQLEKFIDYYLGVRRDHFFKTLAHGCHSLASMGQIHRNNPNSPTTSRRRVTAICHFSGAMLSRPTLLQRDP